MSKVRVKVVDTNDKDEISALLQIAIDLKMMTEDMGFDGYSDNYVNAMLRCILTAIPDPRFLVIVAKADREVVGGAIGEIVSEGTYRYEKMAMLKIIGVVEGCKEKGVGNLLGEKFKEWARGAGAEAVISMVYCENEIPQEILCGRGYKKWFVQLVKEL